MSIPRRIEEFDDNVSTAIESVRVAGVTSWDYIDVKEAGFWNDAWKSVSGVGKVVGDIATGDFADVGKDVKNTAKSVSKATSEGIHDVGQAAKATGNFIKNHWKPIAIGIGMGALALTGVGLAVDAGLIGGAAAAGGVAAAEGAAAAAGAAEVGGAAAAAAGAAEAGGAAAAAGAAEAGGAAAAETAAAAGAEGAAGSAASTTAAETGVMDSGYSGLASAGTKATEAAEDVAGSASKIQKVKDLVNKVPGASTVKKLAPGAAATTGVQQVTSDSPPATDTQTAPPPPPPQVPQMSYAPVSTSAVVAPQQFGAGAAPAAQSGALAIQQAPSVPLPSSSDTPTDPSSIGQMQLAASKKHSTILELVEEFGLYPEDIKHSLTSWQ